MHQIILLPIHQLISGSHSSSSRKSKTTTQTGFAAPLRDFWRCSSKVSAEATDGSQTRRSSTERPSSIRSGGNRGKKSVGGLSSGQSKTMKDSSSSKNTGSSSSRKSGSPVHAQGQGQGLSASLPFQERKSKDSSSSNTKRTSSSQKSGSDNIAMTSPLLSPRDAHLSPSNVSAAAADLRQSGSSGSDATKPHIDDMRVDFMNVLDRSMEEMNSRMRHLRSRILHFRDNTDHRLERAHRRLMAEADHYLEVHNKCKKHTKSRKITRDLMKVLSLHQKEAFCSLCLAFDEVNIVHAQLEDEKRSHNPDNSWITTSNSTEKQTTNYKSSSNDSSRTKDTSGSSQTSRMASTSTANYPASKKSTEYTYSAKKSSTPAPRVSRDGYLLPPENRKRRKSSSRDSKSSEH